MLFHVATSEFFMRVLYCHVYYVAVKLKQILKGIERHRGHDVCVR